MSTLTLLAAAAPKDDAGSSAAASATAVAVAVFALVLGLVQWKRNKTPKIVGWLMLIAGAGIAGAAGWAGDFLRKAGELAGTGLSAGTAKTFGVAIPGAIVAGVALWLAHDLLPSKKAKASKLLPWLALAFPTLLAIVGGVWAGMGSDAVNVVGEAAADVASAFVTAW
ncbi:hypothetical protein ACFY2R_18175 [Micromonospora olivasterospora]|uniref:Uncharacterized protein n=1 Tax=Micromonospora olivasterospora TaxID=1880 RepID=A0A562HU65_MICOL|nr:hypothetical protein [Micromonospora olivasterospora]TWH62281.1 hypothetical protein JD77_06332 [Micromonospora olivasterospora]